MMVVVVKLQLGLTARWECVSPIRMAFYRAAARLSSIFYTSLLILCVSLSGQAESHSPPTFGAIKLTW